jgi:hypothetical protein
MTELAIVFLLSVQLCNADQCRYMRVGWFEDEAECHEIGKGWVQRKDDVIHDYKCTAQAVEKGQ